MLGEVGDSAVGLESRNHLGTCAKSISGSALGKDERREVRSLCPDGGQREYSLLWVSASKVAVRQRWLPWSGCV